MPIVARCPFCGKGSVRAPERAIGLSATCPRCHSCFTIADSAAMGSVPAPASRPALDLAPVAPSATKEPSSLVEEFDERPVPQAVRKAKIESPGRKIEVERDEPPEAKAGPELPLALIAAILGGFGLAFSQTRIGHYGAAGAALLGLLVAGIGLAVARNQKLAPGLAAIFNILILVVIFAMPRRLGLGSWRAARETRPESVLLFKAVPTTIEHSRL